MSLLVVEKASRHFGSLVAVDSVSLTVPPGELRAIIGPNGAGKTTFFNLISGFFPPTSGRILFQGQDVTRASPEARVAMGMARTFQITEIFPELSVRENLRIAVEVAAGLRRSPWLRREVNAEIRQRIEQLLRMGGLHAKASRLVGELPHAPAVVRPGRPVARPGGAAAPGHGGPGGRAPRGLAGRCEGAHRVKNP